LYSSYGFVVVSVADARCKMMIKGKIYRGRAQNAETVIDFWKASHDDAMVVRDIEDILQEVSATFRLFIEWQKEAWDAMRTGKIGNVLEVGEQLKIAYEIGERLSKSAGQCIEWAAEKGYAVENAGALRSLVKEIEELHKQFSAKWPFPDSAEMEANLAAINRGECVDLGEWISDLQNNNPKAHPVEN
jgi:hypothetical protein